jgi:hypothetical protein
MINTNKEIIYKFYGVDLRTKLLLGFIVGFVCILFWFGLLFCYYEYFDSILRIFKQIFFFCLLGLLICLITLRFIEIYSRSLWYISDHHKVKIRVGYNLLTPFPKKNDIKTLEKCSIGLYRKNPFIFLI